MATTQDTPTTPTPSWRDQGPAIEHSVKWRDGDGQEHLHIVRGDTLDEVLLHLRTVKAVIAAARAKDPEPPAKGGVKPAPTCPLHQCNMKPSKWGGWYCPEKMDDGQFCPNKVKAP